MNAVGYFREVSSSRGPTLAQQNRRFLDYCDSKGYDVVTTFTDDVSTPHANAFGQLIEHLKRPEKGFIVVVVPGAAILADEPAQAAARCMQIERLGARVQFMDEAEGQDPLDSILAGWHNAQSDAMREKVQDALHRKAVRGEVLGRPPYGYRVGAKNRLEMIEEEALVVRYIFRLYLHEGLGIRLIARRLNEEGLQTRRNRPWSMVSIRDILRNRSYLGTYQRLGVRVPGTHAALVAPDDFRKVQERLSERRTNYSPRTVSVFLLSGLVRCGNCGNRMIGVSRRQSWTRRRDGSEQVASYRYYQCESRTNQGICGYNTHRAEELEDKVRQKLAETDPKEFATAADDASVIAHWTSEAERIRERIQQLDRRLGRSLEETAAGRLNRDGLRKLAGELSDERLKLEEELRDAEWRSQNYASAVERRRTRNAAQEVLVAKWGDLPMDDRQQLLRELIEHVTVGDAGIEIDLKP